MNLVAQIVKSQGGTVHVRSSQGVGTTVKVSVPLRRPLSMLTEVAIIVLANYSLLNASVGFLGFGALDTDPTTEPLKLKANRRLLNSLKRGCKQLGLRICATDDILDKNASIYIVQMEALERLSQIDNQGLRHSLLSSSYLSRPLIVVCPTRNSALKLRDTSMITVLHVGAQCIWLPVGPGKLAGAVSSCCTFHDRTAVNADSAEPGIADISLVNKRTDDGYTAAVALKTAQSSLPKEVADSAYVVPDVTESRPLVDVNRDVASPSIAPASSEAALEQNKVSQPLQHPHPPLPKRSGSEITSRPSKPSVQLRTQIGRATTAPYRSAEALSLLLVDDNVRIL